MQKGESLPALHTHKSYQMEWLWQKSKAEIICRKNLLASWKIKNQLFILSSTNILGVERVELLAYLVLREIFKF
jgi:hypothetical protein